MAAAPDSSAAMPSSAHSQRAAARISSSSTRTISSTARATISRLIASLRAGARVPAAVAISGRATGAPASRLRVKVGAPTGSTPLTRIDASRALTAVATPEIRPPPPIATITWSISGASARISRPTVPWPAITRGSAKGCR